MVPEAGRFPRPSSVSQAVAAPEKPCFPGNLGRADGLSARCGRRFPIAGVGPHEYGRPIALGPACAPPLDLLLSQQIIGVGLDEQLHEHRMHDAPSPGRRRCSLRAMPFADTEDCIRPLIRCAGIVRPRVCVCCRGVRGSAPLPEDAAGARGLVLVLAPRRGVAIVGRARCLRTGDVATGERLLKPSAVAEVAAGSAELDDYLAARLSAKMLPAAACSARGAQRLASAPRDGILG